MTTKAETKKKHAEEVYQRILKRIDTFVEMGATQEEAESFAFNNEDTAFLGDIGEIQGKHKTKKLMELFELMIKKRG